MSDSDAAPGRDDIAVALRTLGCKVNRAESDSISAELLGRGVRIVAEEDAAVVVVNTCTVTGEADTKARKAVRQALRLPRGPIVVVTGCLAALEPESLQALGERVVVESEKGAVAKRVAELLEPACDAELPRRYPGVRAGEGIRTRALLKIEDGCDNFCTYCIVPYARGVPRGMELSGLVADAASIVAGGSKEIVLTGINIGRYRDPESGADLADLISAVAATGVHRLRLSSIEPPDLTDRFVRTLASTPSVCEHLHVPLQSGSDAVLAAMGRRYTAEEYASRIETARAAIPGLAITTDLIAGFPGETPHAHEETMNFVERTGFAKLHVFRYSARRGTPAAAMEQVAPDARAARAHDLRELGESLRVRSLARMPRRAEVLVERVEDGMATGTTRDYLRVRVPAQGAVSGDTIERMLTAGDVLLG